MPITRNAAESRADLNKALIGAVKLRMQPIAPSDVTPHLTPPAPIQFTSAYGCELTSKLEHYQLPSSYGLICNTLEPYQLMYA